jgi:hypothetical protein
MKRKWCRKKGLRKWDEHLAKVINDKREAYNKSLSTGSTEDEIKYKRCRAVAKREVRKNKRETWNTFVSRLENDVSKPRPKTYKIIRMLRNYTREQVKINPIKKNPSCNISKTYGLKRKTHLLINRQITTIQNQY